MGWKPGKYLGKAIKSIGRGIKKIGKGIGKAFKKVFKGIGKFIGKLGPIGMLGMMLIMPQLGAWWGKFGTWADTAVTNGKFFGNVMKGIHTAGAGVGTAYNTVTGGIQKTLNAATGGTFSTAGAAEYEAGFSDNFANWMSDTLDTGRDFLGLETQQNRAFTKQLEVLDVTSPNFDAAQAEKFYNAPNFQDAVDLTNSKALIPHDYVEIGGHIYETAGMNAQEFLTSWEKGSLNPFGQVLEEGAPPVLSGREGYVAPKPQGTTDPDTKVPTGTGADDVKEDSFLEKAYKGTQTATGAYTLGQQILGKDYDDDAAYFNPYVADVALPMYESANLDWTNQGMSGTPTFGAGNSGYFQSVVNSFGVDPWYMYMQRTQQV